MEELKKILNKFYLSKSIDEMDELVYMLIKWVQLKSESSEGINEYKILASIKKYAHNKLDTKYEEIKQKFCLFKELHEPNSIVPLPIPITINIANYEKLLNNIIEILFNNNEAIERFKRKIQKYTTDHEVMIGYGCYGCYYE